MILQALIDTLYVLLAFGFLVLALGLTGAVLYAISRIEKRGPERREEPPEHDDGDWCWPARKVGPVGRIRIDDRDRWAA